MPHFVHLEILMISQSRLSRHTYSPKWHVLDTVANSRIPADTRKVDTILCLVSVLDVLFC